ncbi:MAG: hypothetical protein JW969_14215 [Spirochaetales bacterium]|nr:hypothetical protein [Spirochaetales bacterium]
MKRLSLFLVVFLLAAVSCVSTGSSTGSTPPPDTGNAIPEEKDFLGAGQSESLGESMRLCKADALKKAVIDLIGEDKERANAEKLQSILYADKTMGGFILNTERTRRDKIGEEYIYEAKVTVRMRILESTLKAHGIIGGGGTKEDAVVIVENNKDDNEDIDEVVVEPIVDQPDYDEPTADEKKFIARYVDKMTYLVQMVDDSSLSDELQNIAINSANEYLGECGLNSVDEKKIKKLKEDQRMVYESETGNSISITQWIAQKLDADVYIEIFVNIETDIQMGGKYYAMGNSTLKAYEASTGDLLGSVAYNLPKNKAFFSRASVEAAEIGVIQSLIYQRTMPRMVDQVKTKMNKSLTRGIKYDVLIQSPPNDRVMMKFWKKLDKKIKGYKLISQVAEEVHYSVWLIGDLEKLKEYFYDASEGVAGLENMYLVMAVGKKATFNSGSD